MEFGPLRYHDSYTIWYNSITIRFLTRSGSFHELLIIFMSYIFIILYYIFLTSELIFYLVCKLVVCIKYLIYADYVLVYWRAIHNSNTLDAPNCIGVVTQLHNSSRGVWARERGSHMRGLDII